jgi:hypothetical protein
MKFLACFRARHEASLAASMRTEKSSKFKALKSNLTAVKMRTRCVLCDVGSNVLLYIIQLHFRPQLVQ